MSDWMYPEAPLGPFRLTETLCYYDGPLVFIAENESGAPHLFYILDQDRVSRTDTWAYRPLTPEDRQTLSTVADGAFVTACQDVFMPHGGHEIVVDWSSNAVLSARLLTPAQMAVWFAPDP